MKQGKQKKKRAKAKTPKVMPGTPGFSEELMGNVSRNIQVVLKPLKPQIARKILEFLGSQDPLRSHQLPLSFRSSTLARSVEDRWQAEFHLRGPLKCFYEAVQSGTTVKTKKGYRQNAEIYQLEGFWRRDVEAIHVHWTKEISRSYDAATQLTSETSREVQVDVELRCCEHGCGSINLVGTPQSGRSPDTFWLCRKGIRCECQFPCCCTCGAGAK